MESTNGKGSKDQGQGAPELLKFKQLEPILSTTNELKTLTPSMIGRRLHTSHINKRRVKLDEQQPTSNERNTLEEKTDVGRVQDGIEVISLGQEGEIPQDRAVTRGTQRCPRLKSRNRSKRVVTVKQPASPQGWMHYTDISMHSVFGHSQVESSKIDSIFADKPTQIKKRKKNEGMHLPYLLSENNQTIATGPKSISVSARNSDISKNIFSKKFNTHQTHGKKHQKEIP